MHILYNSMCTSFLKLRRFMKPTALEGKYGGALAFISCDDSKLLLGDKELVIADKAREALACLNPAKLLLLQSERSERSSTLLGTLCRKIVWDASGLCGDG